MTETLQARRPFSDPKLWIIAAVVTIAGFFIFVYPCMLSSTAGKQAARAEKHLTTLQKAQASLYARTGHYAASARDLAAAETGFPAELRDAFEAFAGNNDSTTPQPLDECLFRMVPCSDSTSTQAHWCALVRPAPGSEGYFQYFMTEENVLYCQQEPRPAEKGHGFFMLDALTDVFLEDGTLSWMKLQPSGWRPAHAAH